MEKESWLDLTLFEAAWREKINKRMNALKKELNHYLAKRSKPELINEIQLLFEKFDLVKKYYEVKLRKDTAPILKEYKDKLLNEYFPEKGLPKARNGVSKKITSDFKKIANDPKDVVDLLLFRTEIMIDFTQAHGDIDEPFYHSLGHGFMQACKLIQQEKLEESYKIYCEELMESTKYFGWGLYDDMKDSYQLYLC
jgi:hypothetical protein